MRLVSELRSGLKNLLKSGTCDIRTASLSLAPELLSLACRGGVEESKNAVDNRSGFVVFIEGWFSAATAAGRQIADQES
ncbi:MAG: hypothetical protein ACC649_05500, partial [Myxococcota bacterium]